MCGAQDGPRGRAEEEPQGREPEHEQAASSRRATRCSFKNEGEASAAERCVLKQTWTWLLLSVKVVSWQKCTKVLHRGLRSGCAGRKWRQETALDNHVWGGKEGGGESRKWGGKNLWLFADERDLSILPQRWKETETQQGEGVWGVQREWQVNYVEKKWLSAK